VPIIDEAELSCRRVGKSALTWAPPSSFGRPCQQLKFDTGYGGARSAQHPGATRGLEPRRPGAGATILQEVGYASGAQVYAVFQAWLAQEGVAEPGDLDAAVLSESMSEFFQALGWGKLTLERVGNTGLHVDATEWSEAQMGRRLAVSHVLRHRRAAHDFMARLSGQGVQVMETECRCGVMRAADSW